MAEGVAYQNKDIVSKLAAEYFRDKSLAVYGLELPRIVGVGPTNLPAVEANELRLDNLFEFADGTAGIIDYESGYDGARQKLKYLQYIVRVSERYRRAGEPLKKLRMIVLYTADVGRRQVEASLDIGCLQFHTESAFLSELDAEGAMPEIRRKVGAGEPLDEGEQMLMVLRPLTRRPREEKLAALKEGVELAKRLRDEGEGAALLAAMVAFSDKIIDRETAEEVRRWIQMTKVARIFEEEKERALQEAEREKERALREQEREKDEEKRQALREQEKEKDEGFAARLILHTKLTDGEIAGIVGTFTKEQLREMRQRLAG